PRLLRLLCFVVHGPVLLVGRLRWDGIGDDLWSCAVMIASTDEAGRDDVLARQFPQLKVVARAGRLRTEGNAVRTAGGLRGHDPYYSQRQGGQSRRAKRKIRN